MASSSEPAPTPIPASPAPTTATQRDKALASGAQFVSTDYPEPDKRFSDYRVGLPGGVVARANPVSGDPAWGNSDLEKAQAAAED